MKIKATIFDFDEVIIKSYKDHLDAFIEVAKKHGIKVKREEVKRLFGLPAKQMFKKILPTASNQQIEKMVKERDRVYLKLLRKRGTKLVPYLKNFLKFLEKNNFKIAIASSSQRKSILIALEMAKIKHYFEAIVSVEDTKKHKPHPEPLLKAAKLIGVKPKYCAYIGDSIYEMIAAKRAKMKAFGLLTGSYSKKQLMQAGADYVAKNYLELKNYFKKQYLF